MVVWDPTRYLQFADVRARPFLDLIAQIPTNPLSVIDLGCGPGHLTKHLRARWPSSEILGIDDSAEMVDRAIRESNLGFNPIVDGTNLRIPLPELNEQRRKELVKIAHQYAEQARVAVRHVRRDGMDNLKKAEKEGDLSQDDVRSRSDKVQKLTDDTIAAIDAALVEKEAEIMHV